MYSMQLKEDCKILLKWSLKSRNMNLQVLLSVMDLKKDDLDKMNIASKCVVINQCDKDGYEKYKNFDIYSYTERGAANSRNRGSNILQKTLFCFATMTLFMMMDMNKKLSKNLKKTKMRILLFLI